MWIDNLSIPRKLTLAFAVTLASSAISTLVVFGVSSERRLVSAQSNTMHVQQFQAMKAVAAHLDMGQTVRGYLLTGVERHKKLYQAAAAKFDEEIRKAIAPAETGDGSFESLSGLRAMQSASHEWRSEIGDRIIKLSDDPKTRPQALEIAMSARSSEMQQKFRDAQAEALRILDQQAEHLDSAQESGESRTFWALTIGGAVAFLSALASAILLSRNIARPLGRLAAQIGELARGTTSISFVGKGRRDDIGLIAAACENFREAILEREHFEQRARETRERSDEELARTSRERESEMNDLQSSVAVFTRAFAELARGDLHSQIDRQLYGPAEQLRLEYNATVHELRDTIRDVMHAAFAIDSASNEISGTTDDLARRTEQQAANLEQAAAALDEVTSATRASADRAADVGQIVAHASAKGAASGDIVRNAVAAMSQIEASAQEISDIIGVIDDIAFQTNLLALNAGVEAARAGEAGRGFAVVAQEIRGLAQRAGDAAKQIKELITASGEHVRSGVDLVGQAGTALQVIIGEVAEIHRHVGAIVDSARQQAATFSDINASVSALDKVTQQNAAAVEETTAATETLAQEARGLVERLKRFDVGAESGDYAKAA